MKPLDIEQLAEDIDPGPTPSLRSRLPAEIDPERPTLWLGMLGQFGLGQAAGMPDFLEKYPLLPALDLERVLYAGSETDISERSFYQLTGEVVQLHDYYARLAEWDPNTNAIFGTRSLIGGTARSLWAANPARNSDLLDASLFLYEIPDQARNLQRRIAARILHGRYTHAYAEVLRHLSRAYTQVGMYDKATDLMAEAIRRSGHDTAEDWLQFSRALADSLLFDAADSAFSMARTLPNEGSAGKALVQLITETETYIESAKELARLPAEENANVELKRAALQQTLARYRDSERTLRKAARLYPDDVRVLGALADLLFERGQGEEAVKYYLAAAQLPDASKLQRELALLGVGFEWVLTGAIRNPTAKNKFSSPELLNVINGIGQTEPLRAEMLQTMVAIGDACGTGQLAASPSAIWRRAVDLFHRAPDDATAAALIVGTAHFSEDLAAAVPIVERGTLKLIPVAPQWALYGFSALIGLAIQLEAPEMLNGLPEKIQANTPGDKEHAPQFRLLRAVALTVRYRMAGFETDREQAEEAFRSLFDSGDMAIRRRAYVGMAALLIERGRFDLARKLAVDLADDSVDETVVFVRALMGNRDELRTLVENPQTSQPIRHLALQWYKSLYKASLVQPMLSRSDTLALEKVPVWVPMIERGLIVDESCKANVDYANERTSVFLGMPLQVIVLPYYRESY